ncbi:MAG: zinc ABC transporter substrate-binding protein [Litoricola sp.]|nr:zinc ABC transporter substrate-binding protein [Litorivicinus sp.]MBL6810078.1 zinc ABC transporter substrate-binding protein [Litorivicinus sp.]MBL6905761.1 zinc ABC transporter substrate-binding protein [Pseudomonadales bacterium]
MMPVNADDSRVRIVTSFTILEDLVQELGGEHVSVLNLVPRNSDAHMYRPKPSDSVAIANADLVVFNGLGFEGWITRLIEDAGKVNKQLIASDGVSVITHDQETDPHAWQSFQNIRIYIQNISGRLIAMLPQHTDDLARRQLRYLDKLDELESNLLERLADTPVTKRIVVTSHDAFGYLGREFDIQFLAPLGLSLDAEPSAEEVALVIDQIQERNVTALFLENISNPRLLETIAAETGTSIGGRLYSDALSELDEPAGTYLDMMRHNIESLVEAFGVTNVSIE